MNIFDAFIVSLEGVALAIWPIILVVIIAVICLVANTTPIDFGAIGLPIATLAQAAGVDVNQLSVVTTMQLSIMIIIIPLYWSH